MIKRTPKHELPIIPTANLVDIAMLLIIFYMTCSNFVSQSALKLTPPKAPDLAKVQEPLVLVAIDRQGGLSLQGRPVMSADDIQSGVTDLIKDKPTEDGRHVMFKCDESIDRTVFEPVLDAIVQAGGVIVAVGESTTEP